MAAPTVTPYVESPWYWRLYDRLTSSGKATPAPSVPAPVDSRATSAEPAKSSTLPTRAQMSTAGATAGTEPARTWQDEVMYFIMVDRFANGDKTNDADCDPKNPNKFHGGDWQGVIDHLDDLKQMGVSTVWISPPVLNETDFFGAAGYHGYWVNDFYKTDPHFGSLEKLQELVKKAHDKGMKVVMDLIVNHTGYNHPFVRDPEKHDWFHHEGDINWVSETNMENGCLHGLPDLAQENPAVSKYLIDMAKWWVRQTGVDGYRVDAIKHVPKAWLKTLSDELYQEFGPDFLVLGEGYDHTPAAVSVYQRKAGMDALFDFPLSDAIRSSVGHDESRRVWTRIGDVVHLFKTYPHEAWRVLSSRQGNMKSVAEVFRGDDEYPDSRLLSTIIDNHDMPRFASIGGPEARQKTEVALTLMMTVRGIPCIYQGTEDGMGLKGETNRDDKRWGQDPAMLEFVSSLANLRHDSIALRRGKQTELVADKKVFAFARTHGEDEVVVLANRAGSSVRRTLEVTDKAGIAPDARFQDVRTGQIHQVRGGNLRIDIPKRSALVLRKVS
jgi:alpha-amylase